MDEMTGVYNRRGFLVMMQQQLSLSKRTGQGLLLLFGDLDGLKGINDVHGHAEGDLAITQTAHVLREALRTSDILARFGGDEFAALLIPRAGSFARRRGFGSGRKFQSRHSSTVD
jgi:diguanylate cyclase (GGDEF)-like protein